MAIQPVYADLSRYQRGVQNAQQGADLLNSLIGGLQQGIKLQQLPQTIQTDQLAQQLQNAINLQKLQDLQNPQAALARDIERQLTIKGALNPELGITRSPVGLVGETVFNPAAITAEQQAALPSPQLQAQRQLALEQAGIPLPEVVIPTAPAALPETPVSAFGIQTGLNINPNIPEQAQEDKLNRQIQLANARVRSSGVQGQFIPDGFGGMIFAQRPTTPTGEVRTTRVTTPEGEAVKVAPKVGRVAALTPNAQMTLLGQATAAGIDPDNPKYRDEQTGTYDFTKIAIDKGAAIRENKRLENAAKSSELKGKTKTDVDALNAAEKQLHVLQDEIDDIVKSGKTPSLLDDMIASGTAAPASGYLGPLARRLAKGLQSEESKVVEGKKSVISSALIKAISGLAVSKDEAKRLGFVPSPGDSFEELIMKASLVQDYIDNQRSGLTEGTSAPRTSAPSSSGTKIGRFTIINTR